MLLGVGDRAPSAFLRLPMLREWVVVQASQTHSTRLWLCLVCAVLVAAAWIRAPSSGCGVLMCLGGSTAEGHMCRMSWHATGAKKAHSPSAGDYLVLGAELKPSSHGAIRAALTWVMGLLQSGCLGGSSSAPLWKVRGWRRRRRRRRKRSDCRPAASLALLLLLLLPLLLLLLLSGRSAVRSC